MTGTEDPAVVDERIHAYKGVHNRMGQGNINDKFHAVDVKDTVFGDDAIFDVHKLPTELDRTWRMTKEDLMIAK